MSRFKVVGRRAVRAVVAILSSISLLPVSPVLLAPAQAALTTIALEDVRANHVILGALASRSQNAQLSISGANSPYTMTALATATRGAYSYQTDSLYGKTQTPPPTDIWTGHGGCGVNLYNPGGCLTQLRESDERPNSTAASKLGFSGNKTGTDTGKTGIVQLFTVDGYMASTPAGGRGTNQMANGEFSYGTVFGPEIYSVPFLGSAGQAVTYQWKALGTNDDYEVYGFLVKISEDAGSACTSASGAGSYGLTNPTSTHTVVSYGRGMTAAWTTATGSIATDGCYRFRFVGGTYDASGGLRAGAAFYIYDVKLGEAQNLDFTQPADMLRATFSRTFTAVATSNAPGATLAYASTTPSVCTVTGTTVTVLANASGICSLRADSAGFGDYGAAPTAYTSFQIQVANTAPISTGGNSIAGDARVCSTLAVDEGSWSSGGASITGTNYQWKKNGSPIIGETNSTYTVQSGDAGGVISYDISKTNSVGKTTATSTSVIPVDARLSGLGISSGALSQSFNGCSFSYSAASSRNSITVTPTLANENAGVTVGGVAVVSGQASGPISLNPGSNPILIVVTNGAQSQTTTLTVTYGDSPAVTVLPPTSLTGTGGILTATVNANGQSTSDIKFEISTDPNFASDAFIVSASPSAVTGTADTSVTALSPTLVKETTYYLRAFATNAYGTTTSSILSFTTPAAPIATSNLASGLSPTDATLNGSVVGNGDEGGASTTVVFEYSVNADMSSPTEVSPTNNATILGGDKNTSAVSKALTGLQTGSTYYYRVKATNNYGTNYGSVLAFTLKGAPSASTQSATSITTTTANLNGIVNANGDATTAIVFRWGTSADNLSNTLSVNPTSVAGNSNTSVLGRLTGLVQNTTYYFQLSATNSIGTTQATPVASFTTAADARPSAILSAPGNSLTGQAFTVTVNFSEPVTGFSGADIVLSGTDSAKWIKQIAQEISKSVYTVEFRPNSPAAGTLTVGLAQNLVLDSANQGNTAATSVTIVTSTSVIAPVISYPAYSIAGAQNLAITPLIPSNTGGIIDTWSISGPLPTGLSFSTVTGQFSGTPAAAFTSATFDVTATNTAGSAVKTITVFVEGQPVISYTPSIVSAFTGTAITPLTPANSGVTANSWGISPALPAGLVLNTSTGDISGTPTATSPATTYTITATTSLGATGITAITISVAAKTVPGRPTNLLGNAGDGQVTLTWVAPTDNGGANIITYKVEYSTNGGANWADYAHPNSSSSSLVVTGLNSGTSYIFRVAATNSVGTGTYSLNSATVNLVAPLALSFGSSPVGVVLGEAAGTHTVSAATTPLNTGQTVFASTTPLVCTVNASTGALTILSIGTCTITANNAGTANYSAAPTQTQNIPVSSGSLAGLNLADLEFLTSASVVGSTRYTLNASSLDTQLTLTIPSGALPSGTLVKIYLNKNLATAGQFITSTNYLLNFVIGWQNTNDGSLPIATTPLVINAVNASIKKGMVGYGILNGVPTPLGTATSDGSITMYMTEDPLLIVAPTKPDAPTGVQASSGLSQSSVVSWTVPVNDGGDPITSYRVTASQGGGTCTVNGANATSCTFSNLQNGTNYTFTVQARNQVGLSDPSASSNSVTPAGPPTFTAPSAGLSGIQNSAYSLQLSATGASIGSGNVAISSYALTSGTLPAGLSLNSSSGRISGTPASTGSFAVTITATDANSQTASASFTIQIDPATQSSPIAMVPALSTPIRSASGFTVTVTNYDSTYVLTAAVSAGSITNSIPNGSNWILTVTGLSPGQSATITVEASRIGYVSQNSALTSSALDASIERPAGSDPSSGSSQVTYRAVTFNSNGGTGKMPAVSNHTATALPASSFVRIGFVFTSWNTKADGTGLAYADKAIYTFVLDLTLYAQWAPVNPAAQLKLLISTFVGDKSVLTSKMRATIAAWVKKLPKGSIITCRGSTSGKNVTAFDKRLASARAKNVCVEAVRNRRDLTYFIQLNPSSSTKPSARHVWIITN